MLLENGRISKAQLVYLMTGFLYGSAVILGTGKGAGRAGWLAVILGVAEASVIVLIFATLSRRFPGKSFVEIADIVYGSVVGKVVSLFFIWFILQIAGLVVRTYGDFLSFSLLPGTPLLVIMAGLLVVSASAVRNGIEVIARASQFIVPIALATAAITFLLLLKDIRIENFFPVFEQPLLEVLKAGHAVAMFPGGETVAFMMITPFVRNKKGLSAVMVATVALTGVFGVLVAIQNVGVLGDTLQATVYPTYSAARLLRIGDILTRLEIFEITNLVVMGFIQLTVCYFGAVLGLAQLARLRSAKPLVAPVGILIVLLALLFFNNIAEHFEFSFTAWPVYAPFFEVGLPLTTLLVAMVRRLPKQQERRQEKQKDKRSGRKHKEVS